MRSAIYETLVRWRTWIVNLILALLVVAPEFLNSPEVLAVVPEDLQRWFLLAGFLLNILMRPRAAVMSHDPEAEVSKAKRKK